MTGKELATALGISEATYHRHRARGDYKRFEIARLRLNQPPRYARALVEQWLAGGPIAVMGAGARTMRRAS